MPHKHANIVETRKSTAGFLRRNYANNKDRHAKYHARWVSRNRSRRMASIAEYQAKNADRLMAYRAARYVEYSLL